MIEAIELSVVGFTLWGLLTILPSDTPQSIFDLIIFLVIMETALLGSWVLYNAYIRIARATGRTMDIAIWIFASLLTGTYTFWAWIILDINRWIVAKLLYQGEAPVEYALSWRSKLIRKLWEETRKAGQI